MNRYEKDIHNLNQIRKTLNSSICCDTFISERILKPLGPFIIAYPNCIHETYHSYSQYKKLFLFIVG